MISTQIVAHRPQYSDIHNTSIDLLIEHPDLGTIPFTASATDTEALGRSLHARAVAGEFGEIAEYDGPSKEEMAAEAARYERDRRLADLDTMVSNPLRWASFTSEQQTALAAYRQALLDVPQQAGFPLTARWPEFPALDE